MQSLRNFLKSRARAAGLAAVLGAVLHLTSRPPNSADLKGLAAWLGEHVKGHVQTRDIAWEPRRGALTELMLGRRMLFLASEKPNSPRELYRATVRLSSDGKPISLRSLHNLTNTPFGDDVGLLIRGETAVFATVAYERIQAISILNLAGIRKQDRLGNHWDDLLLSLTALQETGSLHGIGRTSILLDSPVERARLVMKPDVLLMELGAKEKDLHFDFESHRLTNPYGKAPYGARAIPQIHPPKPFILWGVDTVRAEVGPEPIAWLENKVFGLHDLLKRAGYAVWSSVSGEREYYAAIAKEPAGIVDSSEVVDQTTPWPPPDIRSIWKTPKPEEGRWQAVDVPFLNEKGRFAGNTEPPPYFYQTFIRPDPERPYSEVMLIAFDMRQLELRVQAGYEDPKPTTGPPGDGRLPEDPTVFRRVVATFNGAFKTTHGEYGMMVNRRVLVPPVPGAATVLIDSEGNTGLGNWPQSPDIPKDVVSLRQNLDPLVEDGVPNPSGRHVWGWELQGQGVLTQRTALCVTQAGHLYYAWAEETDGATLGLALSQAGCVYGVHLDMNPGHCGFVYTDIVDLETPRFNLALAHPKMKLRPDKFIRYSPKDFFYLLVREPEPGLKTTNRQVEWRMDEGTQPAPPWFPGIFEGKLKVGSQTVHVTLFEPDRVSYRPIAGTLEPTRVGGPLLKVELDSSESRQVLAAIGLGHATDNSPLGIAFDGEEPIELKAAYATLMFDESGEVTLVPSGKKPPLSKQRSAVQLPVLAEYGEVKPYAHERGAQRMRSALCLGETGRLMIARAQHDSDTLVVRALLDLGCQHVLELDRGSHHPALMHRAGTGTPPLGRYEESVLYVLGRTMKSGAYRWKHSEAARATKPTGFDMSVAEWKRREEFRKRTLSGEGED